MKDNIDKFKDLINTMIYEDSSNIERNQTSNRDNPHSTLINVHINIQNVSIKLPKKSSRTFDTIAASLLMAVGITLFLLTPPAAAQVRNQNKLQEAQQFMTSCAGYKGDSGEYCRMGQREFAENWADALAGRLSSWRNLAFFFSHYEKDENTVGIIYSPQSACAWRMAIIFSKSDEIRPSDKTNAAQDCYRFSDEEISKISKTARITLNNIHLIGEDDPQAPWADHSPAIAPNCLDSTVTPLSADPAPKSTFVRPPGCPKFGK